MNLRIPLIAVLALAASCKHADTASPRAVSSDPTGLAMFTRSAKVKTAKVSPKGTFVAVLSEENGKRALTFLKPAMREITHVLKPEGESTIGRFYWANDGRVVIEMVDYVGYLAAPVS